MSITHPFCGAGLKGAVLAFALIARGKMGDASGTRHQSPLGPGTNNQPARGPLVRKLRNIIGALIRIGGALERRDLVHHDDPRQRLGTPKCGVGRSNALARRLDASQVRKRPWRGLHDRQTTGFRARRDAGAVTPRGRARHAPGRSVPADGSGADRLARPRADRDARGAICMGRA
jgi:hypothetical protein